MAKMKANPLGSLEMEVVHFSTRDGGSDGDEQMFDQVPVHTSLTGQQTHGQPVNESIGHPDLEKRKMGLTTGGSANPSSPLEGADHPGPEAGWDASAG